MEGYLNDFAELLCFFFSTNFAGFLLTEGKRKTENQEGKVNSVGLKELDQLMQE